MSPHDPRIRLIKFYGKFVTALLFFPEARVSCEHCIVLSPREKEIRLINAISWFAPRETNTVLVPRPVRNANCGTAARPVTAPRKKGSRTVWKIARFFFFFFSPQPTVFPARWTDWYIYITNKRRRSSSHERFSRCFVLTGETGASNIDKSTGLYFATLPRRNINDEIQRRRKNTLPLKPVLTSNYNCFSKHAERLENRRRTTMLENTRNF